MTDFTAGELEIFSRARAVAGGRRISYDEWISLGEACEVARRHADTGGGGTKARALRFHAILKGQRLDWLVLTGRSAIRYLRAVLANRTAVESWRVGLSDAERIKWSSPHAIFDRCPVFGQTDKQPVVKARPMMVAELLRMTGAEAAQLLYDRSPSKAWALRRALDELLDGGTAPRPVSGWAVARERARPPAATVMAG